MNAQVKPQPTIRHESNTNTGIDHVFSFHNGPNLMVLGEVIERSDNHAIIACPTHNMYYRIGYNVKTKEIITESSKSLLDLCSFPSGLHKKVFLNTSLNQQASPDFDENLLERISLFDERVAGHLSSINLDNYQGGECDATLYFSGEILDIDTSHPLLIGGYCNFETASILMKLNSNEEFESQLGLLIIEYAVPNKHINNIDEFNMPSPEVTYHSFMDWNDYMDFKGNN